MAYPPADSRRCPRPIRSTSRGARPSIPCAGSPITPRSVRGPRPEGCRFGREVTEIEPGPEELDGAIPVRRGLAQIRAELGECTRCKLPLDAALDRVRRRRRRRAADVRRRGAGRARGPRGEPFVGPAGELLDKMIEAMGWTRQTVYINNILMCRPPGNRNPQPDEVAACMPFLEAKIASIAPRIIVALGRPAANTLLGIDAPISALRGRFHDRHGVEGDADVSPRVPAARARSQARRVERSQARDGRARRGSGSRRPARVARRAS